MVQVRFVSLIKPPVVPEPWLALGNGGQLGVKRVNWEQRHLAAADWLLQQQFLALQVQGHEQ